MKQRVIQLLPDKLFVSLKKWGWQGDYKSWQEAEQESIGYDADNILEKVKAALLKVKNGEVVYERDSVVFDKIEYAWEILSALLWIAAQNKGELHIIDFGGSLGSTYFQNKHFLDSLLSVSWNIVEQPNFVEEGKHSFENENLKFYYTMDKCIESSNKKIQGILFSSVLQYLEEPYVVLKEVIEKRFQYIIIDRTGFTFNDKMRLTTQKVHPKIYDALYPCWFFSESVLLNFLSEKGYDLMFDFDSLDITNIPAKYKGFVFKLKK
ncbi:MAG: methyltransferase, TIGR04325 family [Tannerella sp.]|jgi:putative methyltransferase (TIGR04325 family)|nr:methyltransferase, TIGR04325 family [Tannerella sp.]